jgi:uncharacterized membrane protein YeaQ/YmgE (transglycosylase-associated protein family)
MNIIVSLVVGALVGWLASVVIGTDSREGLIRNVTAGIAGAYLGGWLLSALQESGSRGGFSFALVVVSSLGAVTLLLLVRRFMPL